MLADAGLCTSITIFVIYSCLLVISGPGSVVGIATAYGLDGPRIESR